MFDDPKRDGGTMTAQGQTNKGITTTTTTTKTKLHGLSSRADYTDREPPLVGEVIANFCG
jgi:hypothetical protein